MWEQLHKRVILSGGNVSRSEASTESKDLLPACSDMDRARSSLDAAARWELPDKFVLGLEGMGSFDYVSVRCANGNSAQDDRLVEFHTIHSAEMVGLEYALPFQEAA